MSLSFIALSILFFAFYALLAKFKKQKKTFNFRVLSALAAGLLFGGVIQVIFGVDNLATANFAELISLFGKGYIKLLQMIVIPLVFVAMISSIMNVEGNGTLSKIAPKIIAVLIGTVAISAAVGIGSVYFFGIDANALVSVVGTNSAIEARGNALVATQDALVSTGLSDLALSIIPSNVFEMLTGTERTATLSTVLFGMFLGYSTLQVKKRKPEKVAGFIAFINASKEVVLSMVREILKLTPYGVFALMTSFMMTNDLFALAEMGRFLIASYAAIGAMFVIHFVMVSMLGLSSLKVLDYELARTGISEKMAAEHNVNISVSTIADKNQTDYYPGQEDIKVKLLYQPDSHVLLGGEIIGKKGAVSRINALAVAISAKLTTQQLGYLDFAYAPPFSRTWDALNVAGNVAK